MSRVRAGAVGVLFAVLLLLTGTAARAGDLTPEERASLAAGAVVKRRHAFDFRDGRYVGGVAYVVIHAPAKDVMAVLLDVGTYTSILPLTAEARVVGRKDDDPVVTLRHYTRLATAGYTVRVHRASPGLVRFWMDRSYAHDLEDCWGYFRVQPLTKDTSLLTYGAAMNLGFGFARMFLESKIQGYALETPELIRRYVEARRAMRKAPGAPVDAPAATPKATATPAT